MKVLINIFKILTGGISLLLIFLIIIINIWDIYSIFLLIICTFLFLISSKSISKPLYLLIIPSGLVPFYIDIYFKYDDGKGIVMCTIMLLFAITASYIVRYYYSQRKNLDSE